jgi:hypothetical protein
VISITHGFGYSNVGLIKQALCRACPHMPHSKPFRLRRRGATHRFCFFVQENTCEAFPNRHFPANLRGCLSFGLILLRAREFAPYYIGTTTIKTYRFPVKIIPSPQGPLLRKKAPKKSKFYSRRHYKIPAQHGRDGVVWLSYWTVAENFRSNPATRIQIPLPAHPFLSLHSRNAQKAKLFGAQKR